jgi:hypothetical protein
MLDKVFIGLPERAKVRVNPESDKTLMKARTPRKKRGKVANEKCVERNKYKTHQGKEKNPLPGAEQCHSTGTNTTFSEKNLCNTESGEQPKSVPPSPV